MKIPFRNIFKSKIKSVPEPVIAAFNNRFPGAFNIDWDIKEDGFEAIFYIEDVEHIARLSMEGAVVEYKKNLWLNELPEKISAKCHSFGEIMNCILIYRDEQQFFEVIVRDSTLIRSLYLFNHSAGLISSREL